MSSTHTCVTCVTRGLNALPRFLFSIVFTFLLGSTQNGFNVFSYFIFKQGKIQISEAHIMYRNVKVFIVDHKFQSRLNLMLKFF